MLTPIPLPGTICNRISLARAIVYSYFNTIPRLQYSTTTTIQRHDYSTIPRLQYNTTTARETQMTIQYIICYTIHCFSIMFIIAFRS